MSRALAQRWPRPRRPRPIVSIGAGGIVRDAHLPAYRMAGFEVAGLFDRDRAAARKAAELFGVPRVFATLAEAARAEAVFDVAVPADQILPILRELPRGAIVLIQKPMGRDLAEARAILALCRRRELCAAVNFQLNFAPAVLALKDALARGRLGELCDVDVRINCHMPFERWTFLRGIPRMEVLYHSIHYLDLLRHLLGEARGVRACALPHREMGSYADVRTSAILDFGSELRVSLFTNHAHRYGLEHAASQIQVEGTRGAAWLQLGVNLDYPEGRPDALHLAKKGARAWTRVALKGSWFVEGFMGPMSNLQRFAAGEDEALVTGVEDAIKTMALVEACYRSSASKSTPIPGSPQ